MRKLDGRACRILSAELGETLVDDVLGVVVGGQAPQSRSPVAYVYDPQKRAADVANQLQHLNDAARNSPYSPEVFNGFTTPEGRAVPGMFDLYSGRAPNDGHGAYFDVPVPKGSTVTRIGGVNMEGETRVRIDLPGAVVEAGNHNASAVIPGQQLLPTSTWNVEHPFVARVAVTNPLETKGGEVIHGTGGALEAKLDVPALMNNADAAGHVSLRLNDPVTQGNPERSSFGAFERGLAEKGLVDAPVDAAHASAPVDAAHAMPGEIAPHAATPVEVAAHPGAPVEVAAHPGAPVEVAAHPGAPVEVAAHPGAPVEVAAHPGAPVESAPLAATPVEGAPHAAPVEGAPHGVAPETAASPLTEASHGVAAEPSHAAPSLPGNAGTAFVDGLKGALDPTLGLRALPSTVLELANPGATLESFHTNGGMSGFTGRVVGGSAAALIVSEVGGLATHYIDNHLDGWVDKGTAQTVRDIGATAGTFLTESAPVAAWTSWALEKAGVPKEWADRGGIVADVGARFIPIAGQAYTVGATAYGLYKAGETGLQRLEARSATSASDDPFRGPATMVDLTNSVVTTTPPATPEPEAAPLAAAPHEGPPEAAPPAPHPEVEAPAVPAAPSAEVVGTAAVPEGASVPAAETHVAPAPLETPAPEPMVGTFEPAPAVASYDPVPAYEPPPAVASYEPVPAYEPPPAVASYEPVPAYEPPPVVASYDPGPSYTPDYSGGGYSDFGGGGFSDGGGYA
jgi:hypothetical protein